MTEGGEGAKACTCTIANPTLLPWLSVFLRGKSYQRIAHHMQVHITKETSYQRSLKIDLAGAPWVLRRQACQPVTGWLL